MTELIAGEIQLDAAMQISNCARHSVVTLTTSAYLNTNWPQVFFTDIGLS
jgi:hypothetical protein